MDITTFHFIRPWWLLMVPLAIVIQLLWQRHANPLAQWSKLIAPHLLRALLVGNTAGIRLKPMHLVSLSLICAGIAIAGPSWEKEQPPFSQDKAPLVVAVDLSRSMDATDIAPTRLERVRQKTHDLARLRPGARTGLVVYAGSAHMVVPSSEDPAILQIFLDALSTDLMPTAGKNATAALAEAEHMLGKEDAPGTIVFFSDGFDTAQIPAFKAVTQKGLHQILLIAVGTDKGGPLRTANGGVAVDSSGRPVSGSFDGRSLKQLSSDADVPMASLTLDDDDMEWVQRRAQKHLQQVEAANSQLRWKESGYWLSFPIALLAALWFRRGWVVRWGVSMFFVTTLITPAPAEAAPVSVQALVDLFMTPDQQGRWHFERGEYAKAAEHFADPMWKGLAYSRAGQYQAALGEFARLDNAEGYFEMGNCYARLHHYPESVKAYDLALKARPGFPEASANRKLVAALIKKDKKDDEGEEDSDLDPDEIKFDNKSDKGKVMKLSAQQLKKQNADMWMRNLQTSPADFLRVKFRIQASESKKAARP